MVKFRVVKVTEGEEVYWKAQMLTVFVWLNLQYKVYYRNDFGARFTEDKWSFKFDSFEAAQDRIYEERIRQINEENSKPKIDVIRTYEYE